MGPAALWRSRRQACPKRTASRPPPEGARAERAGSQGSRGTALPGSGFVPALGARASGGPGRLPKRAWGLRGWWGGGVARPAAQLEEGVLPPAAYGADVDLEQFGHLLLRP